MGTDDQQALTPSDPAGAWSRHVGMVTFSGLGVNPLSDPPQDLRERLTAGGRRDMAAPTERAPGRGRHAERVPQDEGVPERMATIESPSGNRATNRDIPISQRGYDSAWFIGL